MLLERISKPGSYRRQTVVFPRSGDRSYNGFHVLKYALVFVASTVLSDEAAAKEVATVKPPGQAADAGATANAAIRAALQRKVSVEFIETPLGDVVEYLRDVAKVEFQLDRRALEDVGLDAATPVTFSLKDVSFRSLLRLLLRELELTYVVRDEVLLVTTAEEAEGQLSTRVFPVRDLVWSEDERGGIVEDYDSLIGLVTRVVKPASWDELGGPASLSPLRGTLVVAQTDEGFEQLEDLLTALRSIPRLEDTAAETKLPPAVVVRHQPQPWRQRFADALNTLTEFEFLETPLADVAAYLSQMHGIPVVLELRALENAGIGEDIPVTNRQKGISLRSALRLMLRELDATFVIENEVLLITTPEESESHLQTVLYPVGDLLDRGEAGQATFDQFDEFVLTILSTIAPNNWPAGSGPGPIGVFPSHGLLVIEQTDEVHVKIGQLLSNLRAAPKSKSRLSAIDSKEFVLRTYPLTVGKSADYASDVENVTDLLERLVTPDQWSDEGGSPMIRFVGPNLVVYHRRDAHRGIKQLLLDIGILAGTAGAGGSGFGGGGFGGAELGIPEGPGSDSGGLR